MEETKKADFSAQFETEPPVAPTPPPPVEVPKAECGVQYEPLPSEELVIKEEIQQEVEEIKMEEDLKIVEEIKTVEQPEQIAPVFLTPLVGATVREGVKFTFECR